MEHIKKFEPFFGEWYAESFIGAGSFGRVYKIYREELGQRMYSAMKYISIPQDASEAEALLSENMSAADISTYYGRMAYQLRDEISLMNELKGNTNIVSYEDSRIVPKADGVGYDIFIRMELLEPLRSYEKHAQMTEKETVRLGREICGALELCDKEDIIHRDIKPENIFVNKNGSFKLGDFGIARRLDSSSAFMSRKGTYNYMAPEVYRGEKYGSACDIYSLGLVMYAYLNDGRLPFLPPAPNSIMPEDREKAFADRMSGTPLPPPHGAGYELSQVILKACAFKPEDRYASAAEMNEALSRVQSQAAEAPAKAPAAVPNGTVSAGPAAAAAIPADGTQRAYNGKIPAPAQKKERTFCTKCGAKLMDGALFCPNCGYRLSGEAAKAAPVPPVQQARQTPPALNTPPAQKTKEEKDNKRTGLIIGLAAAALCCLVVAILAIAGVFGGGGDKSSSYGSGSSHAAKTAQANRSEAAAVTPTPKPEATANTGNTPSPAATQHTEATPSPTASPTPVPAEQLAADDYVTSGTFYIRSAATGEYLALGGVKTNTSTGKSGYYFKLVTDRGKAISFSPCEVNGNTCRLLSGWIQGGGNYYLEAFNSTKSLTGADIWGKGRDIDQIWILEKQWDGTYCIYLDSNHSMLLTLGDSGKGDPVCVTGINYTDEQKWELVLLGV